MEKESVFEAVFKGSFSPVMAETAIPIVSKNDYPLLSFQGSENRKLPSAESIITWKPHWA